jgi:hypothetical protein
MFVRLSKAKRLKAGWLLALLYMLCVVAPGISFALPGGSRTAACLSEEGNVPGAVHVQKSAEASAPQTENADQVHEHPAAHAYFGPSGGHKDMAYVADDAPAPANEPHKTSGAQCCGASCLSALPATIVDIVKPSAPASIRGSETYRNAADNAPPQLYRPPIA